MSACAQLEVESKAWSLLGWFTADWLPWSVALYAHVALIWQFGKTFSFGIWEIWAIFFEWKILSIGWNYVFQGRNLARFPPKQKRWFGGSALYQNSLKMLFNINGKATVWHTPCFIPCTELRVSKMCTGCSIGNETAFAYKASRCLWLNSNPQVRLQD